MIPMRPAIAALVVLIALLSGCGGGGGGGGTAGTTGGGTSGYTVGGTITGLTAGGLILSNGTDTVSPAANASTFTFPTALSAGAAYSVSVSTQPTGLTCTVGSGSGTMANTNITTIHVTCSATGVSSNWSTCAQAGLASGGGSLCLSSQAALAINGSLNGVAYGNGIWVAVGSNSAVATSTDAANWVQRSAGVPAGVSLYGVAFGNGLFVAAGDQGTIIWSTDGANWTKVSGTSSTAILLSVAYGNGQWITAGQLNSSANTYVSVDGKTWSAVTPTLAYLDRPWASTTFTPSNMSFGNGQWLGMYTNGANSGYVVRSTDARNWTVTYAGNVVDGLAAAYGNGIWVGVEEFSAMHSADALNWTSVSTGSAMNLLYFQIRYANSAWVAVGGNNGIVATSGDGTTWKTVRTDSSGFTQQLHDAAYGGGHWVIVGGGGAVAGGVILVSPTSSL